MYSQIIPIILMFTILSFLLKPVQNYRAPQDMLLLTGVAEDIWLHIDAAYAGSAFICREFRPLLSGVEVIFPILGANSSTINTVTHCYQ